MPDALQGTSVFDFGKSSPSNNSQTIQPTDADNILANDNEANLRASLRNGNNFRDGDLMRLDITADKNGLLLVLDVNANGELTQLYPNPEGINPGARPDGKPAGWVRADYQVVIPDSYSGAAWPMRAPYGPGKLYVVLVEDGDQVQSMIDDSTTRAFGVVANPGQHLGSLRQRLDGLIDVGDIYTCLLYTSPSPRDKRQSRMPSSA